jgi:hypothetical protein
MSGATPKPLCFCVSHQSLQAPDRSCVQCHMHVHGEDIAVTPWKSHDFHNFHRTSSSGATMVSGLGDNRAIFTSCVRVLPKHLHIKGDRIVPWEALGIGPKTSCRPQMHSCSISDMKSHYLRGAYACLPCIVSDLKMT